MSLILSIETSTPVCSVAISKDGKPVAYQKLFLEKSHANLLTLLIENLLKECSLDFIEMDAIAVSKGPGSYTGLRIGVSTAKGLCYTLSKPLIAINTLKAMAFEVNQFNTNKALLCPMIDARRMEVYTMLLDYQLNVLQETEAKILDSQSFNETLKRKSVLFFGNGSLKFEELMKDENNVHFIKEVFPISFCCWFVGTSGISARNI